MFALAADSFIVGTKVGILVGAGHRLAPLAATFALVMLFLLVAAVTLLVATCQALEFPFGSDAMDLPVLSYVLGAAEASLAAIEQPTECGRKAFELFTALEPRTRVSV